jgi:cell division protein FtsZ
MKKKKPTSKKVSKKKVKVVKKAKPKAKPLVVKKKKPLVVKKKIAKVAKVKTSKPQHATKESDLDLAKKIKIRVIGIGGGGGNIVAELSKRLKDFSAQKIDFVAANTDNQALHSLNKNIKKFPFGQKLTRGLGTGRDVDLGERSAREDFEKIKNLFLDDRDLYIVISSLGGGTGTGSSPIFTKAGSDFGLPIIGIFTMPFAFEGKKKMDDAHQTLEKMKENLNAYMVLPNEKIFSLAKEDISFTDSLNLLNNRLAMCLDGLLRAIYSPGLINIDWADIRTILEGKRKVAYLNVVKGKINQNMDEFIKSIFKNPILDSQFVNADNVLFNIDCSKELSLQTLAQISQKISELSPNAKIIFGLNQNPKMKNEIKVTILATSNNEKKDLFRIKKSKPIIVKKEPIKKASNEKDSAKKEKIEIIEKKDINKEEEVEEQNIRRNALQAKEAERQALEKEEEEEKIFEIPAFLRKDKKK